MSNPFPILFIGLFPPPITGQSFAFEAAYDNYPGPKSKVNKTPRGESSFSKGASHLRVAFQVFFILCFRKVDKVYMTTFSSVEGSLSDVLVLIFCHFFRKKVIVHLHGSNFKAVILNAHPVYRSILIYLLSRIERGIVLSDVMREQFEFLLPVEKISTVVNFYDPLLEKISPDYREGKTKSETLKVGYLSNLIFSKGILHTVEAIETLFSRGIEVELHVAGKYMDDEYMSADEIQQKFENKLNNLHQIHYHGIASGDEKIEFYKNIDVFVLPTFYRHEAQPISIIEAMRAGCVIVSSDYKYIPDLVSPESGFLIREQTSEALVKELVFILENRILDSGMPGHNVRLAIEKYSLVEYLNKLYAIFASDC